MDKLIAYFKKNDGYARMSDLKKAKFHTRMISYAVSRGIIEKIKPGLYKIKDYEWDESSIFVDVFKANNSAIICLTSALSYYELTTFNPSSVTVAIPVNYQRFDINYPPIQIFYFRESVYKNGVEKVKKGKGEFKIYKEEKTICDMFRYRKKLGEDIALEGLKNYLKRKEANIPQLMHYAEICRVKTIITPYLKGILG